MGFAEELDRARKVSGYDCSWPDLMAALEPEDRVLVEAAMADDSRHTPGAAIARALSSMTGRKVTDQTVNRHRANECVRCAER